MAFSMFLRSQACTTAFRQQLQRLSSQPELIRRTISQLPASTVALNGTRPVKTTTPILDAVRTIRTTPVRMAEQGHDHAKLWIVEKAASALLVPLIPLALVMPCKVLDSAVAILITAHSFWGLQACVVEYARELVVGQLVPKLFMAAVYVFTGILLYGLVWCTFKGDGLAGSFWKLWANMDYDETIDEGDGSATGEDGDDAGRSEGASGSIVKKGARKNDSC